MDAALSLSRGARSTRESARATHGEGWLHEPDEMFRTAPLRRAAKRGSSTRHMRTAAPQLTRTIASSSSRSTCGGDGGANALNTRGESDGEGPRARTSGARCGFSLPTPTLFTRSATSLSSSSSILGSVWSKNLRSSAEPVTECRKSNVRKRASIECAERSSLASASSLVAEREMSSRLKPRRASVSAKPCPSPPVHPVTMAHLPSLRRS